MSEDSLSSLLDDVSFDQLTEGTDLSNISKELDLNILLETPIPSPEEMSNTEDTQQSEELFLIELDNSEKFDEDNNNSSSTQNDSKTTEPITADSPNESDEMIKSSQNKIKINCGFCGTIITDVNKGCENDNHEELKRQYNALSDNQKELLENDRKFTNDFLANHDSLEIMNNPKFFQCNFCTLLVRNRLHVCLSIKTQQKVDTYASIRFDSKEENKFNLSKAHEICKYCGFTKIHEKCHNCTWAEGRPNTPNNVETLIQQFDEDIRHKVIFVEPSHKCEKCFTYNFTHDHPYYIQHFKCENHAPSYEKNTKYEYLSFKDAKCNSCCEYRVKMSDGITTKYKCDDHKPTPPIEIPKPPSSCEDCGSSMRGSTTCLHCKNTKPGSTYYKDASEIHTTLEDMLDVFKPNELDQIVDIDFSVHCQDCFSYRFKDDLYTTRRNFQCKKHNITLDLKKHCFITRNTDCDYCFEYLASPGDTIVSKHTCQKHKVFKGPFSIKQIEDQEDFMNTRHVTTPSTSSTSSSSTNDSMPELEEDEDQSPQKPVIIASAISPKKRNQILINSALTRDTVRPATPIIPTTVKDFEKSSKQRPKSLALKPNDTIFIDYEGFPKTPLTDKSFESFLDHLNKEKTKVENNPESENILKSFKNASPQRRSEIFEQFMSVVAEAHEVQPKPNAFKEIYDNLSPISETADYDKEVYKKPPFATPKKPERTYEINANTLVNLEEHSHEPTSSTFDRDTLYEHLHKVLELIDYVDRNKLVPETQLEQTEADESSKVNKQSSDNSQQKPPADMVLYHNEKLTQGPYGMKPGQLCKQQIRVFSDYFTRERGTQRLPEPTWNRLDCLTMEAQPFDKFWNNAFFYCDMLTRVKQRIRTLFPIKILTESNVKLTITCENASYKNKPSQGITEDDCTILHWDQMRAQDKIRTQPNPTYYPWDKYKNMPFYTINLNWRLEYTKPINPNLKELDMPEEKIITYLSHLRSIKKPDIKRLKKQLFTMYQKYIIEKGQQEQFEQTELERVYKVLEDPWDDSEDCVQPQFADDHILKNDSKFIIQPDVTNDEKPDQQFKDKLPAKLKSYNTRQQQKANTTQSRQTFYRKEPKTNSKSSDQPQKSTPQPEKEKEKKNLKGDSKLQSSPSSIDINDKERPKINFQIGQSKSLNSTNRPGKSENSYKPKVETLNSTQVLALKSNSGITKSPRKQKAIKSAVKKDYNADEAKNTKPQDMGTPTPNTPCTKNTQTKKDSKANNNKKAPEKNQSSSGSEPEKPLTTTTARGAQHRAKPPKAKNVSSEVETEAKGQSPKDIIGHTLDGKVIYSDFSTGSKDPNFKKTTLDTKHPRRTRDRSNESAYSSRSRSRERSRDRQYHHRNHSERGHRHQSYNRGHRYYSRSPSNSSCNRKRSLSPRRNNWSPKRTKTSEANTSERLRGRLGPKRKTDRRGANSSNSRDVSFENKKNLRKSSHYQTSNKYSDSES